MNQANEEKLTWWKNLIAEKKQSSLMLKDFCKEKNITLSQFYYYQAMINHSSKKIIVKQPVSKISPVKIIPSPSPENNMIRFILPNKLECFLPRNMPLVEIKSMLMALMSC